MTTIKGLIFDFDGLILDTEVPDYVSWQEVFESHGCVLPHETWMGYIGTREGAFDPYALLEERSGRPVSRDEVRTARRRRLAELVAAEVIRPGVEAYIADAQRLGIRLAVASSADCDWVVPHLERLGLIGHFDGVRCAGHVTHGKPDPEVYFAALDLLGVAPHQAIAIEDSPNGVLAAKRAGLFCVAVPNPITADLPLDHADLRLNSLADLPLEELIRRVG